MTNNQVHKREWYTIFVLIFITIVVWVFVLGSMPQKTLSISFLDVGQGDAIFIETPHHNQILIDGGPPNKKVLQELRNLMPFYDRSIDVVLATHPDEDHIGGLIDVLNRYQVGAVIDSGLVHGTQAYKQKKSIIQKKSVQRFVAKRGMTLILDKDVYLTILFPDRNVNGFDSNDASIVAQLVYGDHEFLFTGDTSQKMEKYVVSLDGELLESDVLKVGHHGSKTSTSNELLSVVDSQYGVVSAGKDNRYGHPHEEVLERLEEFEVSVLNTQNLGTITFETDGRVLKIK